MRGTVFLDGRIANTTPSVPQMEFEHHTVSTTRHMFNTLFSVDDGAWVSGDKAYDIVSHDMSFASGTEMKPVRLNYPRGNYRYPETYTASSSSTRR